MSASPDASDAATVAAMADEFPLTAEEAQLIADAMTPLQNFTDIGSSVGNTLEEMPGSGNRLVGSVLRNISTQVNLASQSVEVLARAIDFYVTAQAGALEDLFPPPDVLAAELEQTSEPVFDLIGGRQS